MIGRPCILCGRPGTRVLTAPHVMQHLCDGCLAARSEKMPKGFPVPLSPAETVPTREPKSSARRKRKKPSTTDDVTPSTRRPTRRKARKDPTP